MTLILGQDAKLKDDIDVPSKFYYGVVENWIDPDKRGRVQVRVFGLHTELKSETINEGIKTEDLPWAEIEGSPYGSSMTGLGWWGGVPLNGSYVRLYFRDGKEKQQPVVVGTIRGNPIQKPTGELGFEDPDAKWPRHDRLEIWDMPLHLDHARHQEIGKESYLTIRSELVTDDGTDSIATALGVSDPWSEPTSSGGQPEAHWNYTYEAPPRDWESSEKTERHGSVIEIDSTPEYERIVLYHRSGSYQEITPDGSLQTKVRGNSFFVNTGDEHHYTKGVQYVSINGERHLLISEDSFEDFKSSVKQEIADELEQKIGSKKTVEVPHVIHDTDKHQLDGPSNARKVNNYLICPYSGSAHSTQSKTFCSP